MSGSTKTNAALSQPAPASAAGGLADSAGSKPPPAVDRDTPVDAWAGPAETGAYGTFEPGSGFHNEAMSVIAWLAGVVRLLWRIQPYAIFMVICATVLSRFANLAAFLLPLKVLLLAGSDGVPRYFRMLAAPEDKLDWIIGLSAAAVAFFLLGRFLKALAARLSLAGSLEVMKEANQLTLVGNQGELGCRHFSGITALCADLVFVAIASIAITLINPVLAGCLAVLVAIEYAFTAWVLSRRVASPSRLAERIVEDPRDYLQELFTVSFWSGFLCILIPFLAGAGGNILLAILSFVLMRQALRALVAVITSAVNLTREKTLIDALMSPSHQLQRSEPAMRRSFRGLFERKAHLAKLETVLADQFENPRPTAMRWKDSPILGVSTFALTFDSGAGDCHCDEQVFTPLQAHLIKNEDVLFRYIPRIVLGAPAVRAQFTHGPYQCRLCDSGSGTLPPAKTWFREFLEQTWSVAPPEGLIRAYSTSHTLLHERLTPEFVNRLALAVGSSRDEKALGALEAALPFIRATLSAMPFYVSARDGVRSNMTVRSDGRVSLMIWGRWTLEPLGVYLPVRPSNTMLAAMLDFARERRPDIPNALCPGHLRLASACRALERNIAGTKYAAALRGLPVILKQAATLEAKSDPLPAAEAHETRANPVVTLAK